jgi:hypothetical protein
MACRDLLFTPRHADLGTHNVYGQQPGDAEYGGDRCTGKALGRWTQNHCRRRRRIHQGARTRKKSRDYNLHGNGGMTLAKPPLIHVYTVELTPIAIKTCQHVLSVARPHNRGSALRPRRQTYLLVVSGGGNQAGPLAGTF